MRSTDRKTVEKSSEVRTEEGPLDWQFEAIHHLGQVHGEWYEQNPGGNELKREWQVSANMCVCVSVQPFQDVWLAGW